MEAQKEEMFGKPPKFKFHCAFTVKDIICLFHMLLMAMEKKNSKQSDLVQGKKTKWKCDLSPLTGTTFFSEAEPTFSLFCVVLGDGVGGQVQ